MKRGIVLFLMLWGITLAVLGQDTLKVMTYNVRHCAGMDLVLDYDRTAAVIVQQQPDVVALQELDSMTDRSEQRYQLDELASRTGVSSRLWCRHRLRRRQIWCGYPHS